MQRSSTIGGSVLTNQVGGMVITKNAFTKDHFKDGKNDGFFSKNAHHLYKVSMEPFYDYGYIKTKYNGDSGRLSGAGLKTIFSSKYFDASMTYSWGLQKSKLISSDDKENKILYFELGVKCC